MSSRELCPDRADEGLMEFRCISHIADMEDDLVLTYTIASQQRDNGQPEPRLLHVGAASRRS